jgi:uncharacterized protein VirK/YbjX
LEKGENDDMGWRESDLKWGINPKLSRDQRRAILKMLRKQSDFKDILLQQPYRTSPDKQKHFEDAIDTLLRLDVIEPSVQAILTISYPETIKQALVIVGMFQLLQEFYPFFRNYCCTAL